MVVQRTLTPPWEFDPLIPNTPQQPSCCGFLTGVAQLVARLVRDQEAVGSNPVTPTKRASGFKPEAFCFYIFIEQSPVRCRTGLLLVRL